MVIVRDVPALPEKLHGSRAPRPAEREPPPQLTQRVASTQSNRPRQRPRKRATLRSEEFGPFDIATGYLIYVDGRPRFAGVRDFQVSWHITS